MQKKERLISVLGCTGSVGEQALDVADKFGLKVRCLSANKSVERVCEHARKFKPAKIAMADENAAKELKLRLADTDIEIFSGDDGICQMVADEEKHTVVNSIIGEAGLLPTLALIDAGHRVALANKESLVVAGEIVMKRAKENAVEILPVDSEHSAIFQCLKSGCGKEIKKILLTASGGPFYGYTKEQLRSISLSDALAHPTWKMGAKITIDSATLMNKGFEVIEAVHLFDVAPEQIQVVVHRESIIHSAVEYIDNSIIAQLSKPDMRLCVQYAVSYPNREDATIPELDLFSVGALTFKKADPETFGLLGAAYDCIGKGGALPAVLNAANEVAVARFLSQKIPFWKITDSVLETLTHFDHAANVHDLEGILECDRAARERINKILN